MKRGSCVRLSIYALVDTRDLANCKPEGCGDEKVKDMPSCITIINSWWAFAAASGITGGSVWKTGQFLLKSVDRKTWLDDDSDIGQHTSAGVVQLQRAGMMMKLSRGSNEKANLDSSGQEMPCPANIADENVSWMSSMSSIYQTASCGTSLKYCQVWQSISLKKQIFKQRGRYRKLLVFVPKF